MYLSMNVIETYQVIYAIPNAIKRMFDAKSTLIVHYQINERDMRNMAEFAIKADNIKSVVGVKKVGYYEVDKINPKSTIPGVDNYIYVNEDMLDIYNLKDSNGKIINGDTFRKCKNQSIPALTGASLNTDNKDFDIKINELSNTYKRISTLCKNCQFFNNDYLIATINLNNSVIIPFPKESESDMTLKINAVGANRIFVKVDSKNVNKTKKALYKYYEKNGFNVKIYTMEEDIKNYIGNNYEYFIAQLRITICLAIYSMVGAAVVLMLTINKRKREFGIRMATGASKFYLLRLVYGEIMLSLIISYIIALIYYSSKNRYITNSLGETVFQIFNPLFSVIYLLCAFAAILILSFSVVMIILKMQPRDLIGGAK